ncbi:SMI1/KNR4 family protein [Peribacillus sp. FSL K6-1552]|uniref:SMI1/KNR4 family protein n=1 Tax=Peribacillus sp. FSL K6-1552 TaxID=2954514 RepID=UPI0030F9E04D
MNKLIEKVLEYNGPVERFKQSGLTLVYLSQELKEDKNIVYPDNVAYAFFSPVTDDFLLEKEKENNIEFPNLYRELLKGCNGFSLEIGHFNFYGLDLDLWKGFSHKEKAFFGPDVIEVNQSFAPKKISSRFFIIGEDYHKNCWIGIKDEKTYTINRYGKQLEEIDFINERISSVEEFNRNSNEAISHVKGLYKNS